MNVETIERYELEDVGRIESVPVMAKDPDGRYVLYEDMVALVAKYKQDAERYRHITANVIDWPEDGTTRWMIVDQFYEGPTLAEAIDASIAESKR